jgi:DNA repair protein RadD
MNRLALRAALPFAPPVFQPPFNPAFFGDLRPALHDFQLDLLLRCLWAIQAGYTRILLQLPTGGGKTHLAKALLGGASLAQFIVHRKELIEQTSTAFTGSGIAHGFVAADKPYDADANVFLCGIATLAKRLGIVLPPKLAVWDEVHHAVSATWSNVLNSYPPDTIHIGLTATPERLDGQGLDQAFQIMLCGPTTAELIARGFLSPYDYYAPSLPDMTGVNTDGQAEAVMDRPELIGDMVEHYLRLAKGQPGIVFAHSIEHSRHLVEAYQGNGVRAAHIDGEMTSKERERIDAMFRAREIRQRAGELEKLDREAMKQRAEEAKRERAAQRKAEEKACKTHADYYALAASRGYENPGKWAALRMSMKSGGFRFR